MSDTKRAPAHARSARRTLLAPLLIAALILSVALAFAWGWSHRGDVPQAAGTESGATSGGTGQSAPAPGTSDPTAQPSGDPLGEGSCEVSFAGDDIVVDPIVQTEGSLYRDDLPVPERIGQVFAGWYLTPEAATALDATQRVNGSKPVTCNDQRITLHGAWVTPERNTQENAQVPILMYHWFTTKPEGEDDWLRNNYLYIGDFEEHLKYIANGNFYLPTWPELNSFIDGKLFLPDRSVIVTDDDAHPTWVEMGAPLVAKYQVLTTSFVIAVNGAGPEISPYIQKRSHSYDMHTAGDNGKGRMVNWSAEEVAADLNHSAEVLGGAKEVMAYPFGQYNDTAKEGLRLAGFDLARTTEYGYVSIGSDKLTLPCVRIDYGMGVDALKNAIG